MLLTNKMRIFNLVDHYLFGYEARGPIRTLSDTEVLLALFACESERISPKLYRMFGSPLTLKSQGGRL